MEKLTLGLAAFTGLVTERFFVLLLFCRNHKAIIFYIRQANKIKIRSFLNAHYVVTQVLRRVIIFFSFTATQSFRRRQFVVVVLLDAFHL